MKYTLTLGPKHITNHRVSCLLPVELCKPQYQNHCYKQWLGCGKAVVLTNLSMIHIYYRVKLDLNTLNDHICLNKRQKAVFLAGKCYLGYWCYQKWQYFLICWSPTLRRTLWRCRNVGFPRPECRVTAPISAVWWPEEEATEILAWRKKKEGRRRWERQEGIFALSWNLRWNGRTLTRDSWKVYLGEHRLVSVPVCLPSRRVKNWVRGVPLLGS